MKYQNLPNMKTTLLIILFAGFVSLSCQETNTQVEAVVETEISTNGYDSLLAQKLGADDYGMKSYVFAMLKSGPNRSQDSTEAAQIQAGHMANINRLAEEGKLVMAGPFLDGGEYRGIFIFDVATLEEAEELIKTDPAVQSGRLVMELHKWYASAAIGELNELHNKIQKVSF